MEEKSKEGVSLLPGISESTMKSSAVDSTSFPLSQTSKNNYPGNSVSQAAIRSADKFSLTQHAGPHLTDRKSKEVSDYTIGRDSSDNPASSYQISELRSQMKTIIEENRINNLKLGKRMDDTETKEQRMDLQLQMVIET